MSDDDRVGPGMHQAPSRYEYTRIEQQYLDSLNKPVRTPTYGGGTSGSSGNPEGCLAIIIGIPAMFIGLSIIWHAWLGYTFSTKVVFDYWGAMVPEKYDLAAYFGLSLVTILAATRYLGPWIAAVVTLVPVSPILFAIRRDASVYFHVYRDDERNQGMLFGDNEGAIAVAAIVIFSVLIVLGTKRLRTHFIERLKHRRPARGPWKNWGTGLTIAWIVVFALSVGWSGYESCIPSSTYELTFNRCR